MSFKRGLLCGGSIVALFLEREIARYLGSIPAVPENISKAVSLAKASKLDDAAKLIESDPGLKAYVLKKASSPAFSFMVAPKNVSHAFSLFGAPLSVAMLESYLLESLSPKKWLIFKLTNESYHHLQADLISSWQKILDATCPTKAKHYVSAAALLSAAIAMCEAILSDKIEETKILESQGLRLNDILVRLGGMSFYKLASKIGKELGFDDESTNLVAYAEKPPIDLDDKEALKLAKFLHILLFYKLSQPFAIEAGLDDFASCESETICDELENFISLIGGDFEN